jgi:hypothetical protein
LSCRLQRRTSKTTSTAPPDRPLISWSRAAARRARGAPELRVERSDRRRIEAAPSGRYFTPRSASGTSRTMMMALKMTAERMALSGPREK